jgi:chromate reductase
MFEIAAVAGSLRQGSYNQALLRAAQQLAPVGVRIRIHDLSGIPLFSEDVERAGIPPAVARLREAVAEADGFLVATPEYNLGVPGVMKRQSFVFTNTPVLLQPEVLVGRAHEKFDSDGRLTDDRTRQFLVLFLEEFAHWIGRLAGHREVAAVS